MFMDGQSGVEQWTSEIALIMITAALNRAS